ncbi:MAG: prolipoprotein diacylglyceryl transferase [Clostridia bacterium]|nr:prolipoprotein diacylglyceryl transferase [Clostridia bacterium]MBQ8439163.1 prolipoprotein diacylglyceryl transferase [Clostridia bacterium]
METIKVSFPGLGIDPFDLNKIAFTLFGKFEVRWYGVIITMGIFFAFLYAIWRGKRNENIIADDVIDVGLATVFCGVLGARLYYVLTTLDEHSYDSFYDVIAIWEGGLAIYGGIIGGCLGILAVCYFKKLRWQKLFDMIGPGVVIAQAMGRWGNFFNGEAYGYMIEDTTRYYFFSKEFTLPSGEGTLFNTLRMGLIPNEDAYLSMRYYHPTFLYESLWNVLGFILLNIFYKRKKFDGQIALMYFAWYGFGRMFIEGLRTDSLYIPGTQIRISQFLGLACFLVSAALLTFFLIRSYRAKPALAGVAAEGEIPPTEETEEIIGEATENTEEMTETQTQEEKDDGNEN